MPRKAKSRPEDGLLEEFRANLREQKRLEAAIEDSVDDDKVFMKAHLDYFFAPPEVSYPFLTYLMKKAGHKDPWKTKNFEK